MCIRDSYRGKSKHTPSSEDPTKVNFPTYPDHNKSGYSLREANGSSNAKRPPNAPKEDKGDWMLKKSVYNGLASQFGNGTGHFDCDLFSDGRGTENGNQQETVAYSPDNSAFNHLWTGKSYWANPPFIARVIQDYLIKANEDFLINPEQTSHCCVLPYIPTAPWWHLTQYWKVVKVYEKDEFLFHKARTQTYSLNDKKLTPVTSEDGPTNRVFIDPVGYPICVLYRDVHTPVRPDPYVKAHLRFGHCDSQLLNKLVEQGVDLGVNLNQSILTRIKPLCHCVSCKLAKMTRPGPFKKVTIPDKERYMNLEPYSHIVADMTGPINPATDSGLRYSLQFTCLKTSMTHTYFLTRKSEALQKFGEFLTDIKVRGHKPNYLVLKTDSDSVFRGGEFRQFTKEQNIEQRFTSYYLHEQNGLVEKVHRETGDNYGTCNATYCWSGQ